MKIDNLYISEDAYLILKDIAKWTKFLSIVVFILLGISAFGILLAGVLITSMNSYAISTHNMMYSPGVFSWGYATYMLITFIVYLIPTWFLYKFSVNLKRALINNDNLHLIKAWSFLQKHYSFIGVLTAIILVALFVSFGIMFFSIIYAV